MTSCSPTDIAGAIMLCIVLLLEAWLGRTEKTKYSSILELVIMGMIALLLTVFKRGDKNAGN